MFIPVKLVKKPLSPNNNVNHIPWEIEGISMGSVKITDHTPLCRILVLFTHQASNKARLTDTMVVTRDEINEFHSIGPNCALDITSLISPIEI